ncbi:UNVERIFIED_CONTAM: hypothetical protein Sangu_3183800 [Sesamum angustifolium]|uniref:Uncharacterized protein n=1 Tax=Sesamum angustifolium TaxID=2727405 RepID=A0AAW2JN87_9LAMI
MKHEDLQGISPDVITHRLNMNPDAKPVKQKKRMFSAERSQTIKEEVEKLLKLNMCDPAVPGVASQRGLSPEAELKMALMH